MSDFGGFLDESGDGGMKLEDDRWPETSEIRSFIDRHKDRDQNAASLNFSAWIPARFDHSLRDGRSPSDQLRCVLANRSEAMEKAEAMEKVENVTAHIEQHGGCVSDEGKDRLLEAFREQGKTFALDATKPNHASIIHRLSQLAIEQARLYYEAKLNEARQAANEARMNQVKLELDAALMEEFDEN